MTPVIISALVFVFVIGLCIGSFLNVVILRSLSNESVVFPASKCPKCSHPLKWWHNIPVISYLFLRGKCAFCNEKISIQYPIVELLTGIVFTLLFAKYGISIDTLFAWIISAILIVIAGTDIKEKVVFDFHTFILMGTGFVYAVFSLINALIQMHKSGIPFEFSSTILLNNPVTSVIFGALLGALLLELFARLGYFIAGTRAFGEGDTLIAAGLGAVFGWRVLILVLILSVIIQVILFLPVFIKGLFDNKEWKTLAAFLLFVLYAVVFFTLQYLNIVTESSAVLFTVCAFILAILGIVACLFIFKGLREKPENGTYLPYGPALTAAALIMLIL